jgi:hypothetical protein
VLIWAVYLRGAPARDPLPAAERVRASHVR